MTATVKLKNIIWHQSIDLRFGFTGIELVDAIKIVRRIIKEDFPNVGYVKNCLYVIRVAGSVAVAYGKGFSPVLYIGEGNAKSRLHGHAKWLAELLLAVPNLAIRIHVAEVRRTGPDRKLRLMVEADLLQRFADDYGSMPWFNRQFEGSAGQLVYDKDVEKELRSRVRVNGGNKFLWAIKPTHNNETHEPYAKGYLKRDMYPWI